MKLSFKRKVPMKNYLRLYCNLSLSEYSEELKKDLVSFILKVCDSILCYNKLVFDVSGGGYGISKGDSLIGARTLQNRLIEKGYDKLEGFEANDHHENHASGFTIHRYLDDPYLNLYFSWPIDSQSDTITKIVREASTIVNIFYGYSYSVNNRMIESTETEIKRGFFSLVSASHSFNLYSNKELVELKNGKIKAIFPVNVFNQNQVDCHKGIGLVKTTNISDELSIWTQLNDL